MLGLLSFAGVVLKLFFSLTSKAEKLGPPGCNGFNARLNSELQHWQHGVVYADVEIAIGCDCSWHVRRLSMTLDDCIYCS